VREQRPDLALSTRDEDSVKNHWHPRFIKLAQEAASWSKVRTQKVGAQLFNPETRATLLCSFNGFPRGLDDTFDDYHQRPAKYYVTEHAERNLIYFAARHGVRTEGLGIATTLYPCADCARGIVQSGMVELVTVEPDFNDLRWGLSFQYARTMLKLGGVTTHFVAAPRHGELITFDPNKYSGPLKP
jgi:dCMP deaminase